MKQEGQFDIGNLLKWKVFVLSTLSFIGFFFYIIYNISINFNPITEMSSIVQFLYVIAIIGLLWTVMFTGMFIAPGYGLFILFKNKTYPYIFAITGFGVFIAYISIVINNAFFHHRYDQFILTIFFCITILSIIITIIISYLKINNKIDVIPIFGASIIFIFFNIIFINIVLLDPRNMVITKEEDNIISVVVLLFVSSLLNSFISTKGFKPIRFVENIKINQTIYFALISILTLSVLSLGNGSLLFRISAISMNYAHIGNYDAKLTIIDTEYANKIGLTSEYNNQTCHILNSIGNEYYFVCERVNKVKPWQIRKDKVDFQPLDNNQTIPR